MKTMLITGANRGLGLEFVRQYLEDGWRVFATARDLDKAESLSKLAKDSSNLHLYKLDVQNFEEIQDLGQKKLRGEAIDVLINNAGIYGHSQIFGEMDYQSWEETFRVNTIAPMKIAETFIAHLERSNKKIMVILTSKMGSITDNTSGHNYIYRSSKAAVNMVCKSLSFDFKHYGITCALLHPGWVKTDMGGFQAPLEVEESIKGMKEVIEKLSLEDSGKFFNYDGTILPW